MTAVPARGPSGRHQVIRLGGLLLVLAAVLAYRFWPTTESRPASERTPVVRTPGAAAPGAGDGGALPLPEEVRLGTLDAPPGLPAGERNPFAFGVRPAPPPPPQVQTPEPVAAPPPRPQGPPPIALRLVGVTVVPGEGRSMVTLTEPSTSGVYQALEGDVVDGRFRVVRIGVQSVVLSYLDGSGTRTIPLGG